MHFSKCIRQKYTFPRAKPRKAVRCAGSFLYARLVLLCFGLLLPLFAFSAPIQVSVVISHKSAPYIKIAESIAVGLRQQSTGQSRMLGIDALGEIKQSNTDLVVAVGLKATQALVAKNIGIPILSTLIPRASFEKIAAKHGLTNNAKRLSAVFIDQPIARQLDLIRLVLPNKNRVGVIIGPDNAGLVESLRMAAQVRGLKLSIGRVSKESEVFSVLKDILGETDVLLSLPDSLVSTPHTIQSILYTAYLHKVPIIGFSPAYVKAGALISVYSTPEQIARQVTEMFQGLNVEGSSLLPPAYPHYFGVVGNPYVARSLEIPLESVQTLTVKLKSSRKEP